MKFPFASPLVIGLLLVLAHAGSLAAQELDTAVPRYLDPRFEKELKALTQDLDRLRGALKTAQDEGKPEQVAELERKIAEGERQLVERKEYVVEMMEERRAAQRREVEQRETKLREEPRRGEGRRETETANPEELRRRLNHLLEAAEHLHLGGFPDLAHELRRRGEELAASQARHVAPSQPHPGPHPELAELHQHIRQQNERIEKLENIVRKLAEAMERQRP